MEFSLFGIFAVVLELLRPVLPLIGIVVVVDLLLLAMVVGRHRRLDISRGAKMALRVGIIAAIAAAIYFPIWTGAGLTQLASLVDIAGVVGGGLGVGIALGLLSYPPLQLMSRKNA